jgi:hypothetical protein
MYLMKEPIIRNLNGASLKLNFMEKVYGYSYLISIKSSESAWIKKLKLLSRKMMA